MFPAQNSSLSPLRRVSVIFPTPAHAPSSTSQFYAEPGLTRPEIKCGWVRARISIGGVVQRPDPTRPTTFKLIQLSLKRKIEEGVNEFKYSVPFLVGAPKLHGGYNEEAGFAPTTGGGRAAAPAIGLSSKSSLFKWGLGSFGFSAAVESSGGVADV
ncbi:SPBc2 prophage-derived uncharacterized HTH-typetranscriptional regulator YopO [Striga asiatica]|uniref:SPBc2 prophage-derived uncharacterized HTH-typetranscriptional regulator YopO n=1 Tax=Striga asiatica TaxID=4170 RepID=A0A5A7QP60_STRAF|nr:SPBc2 prophage-derived uncharacterized HTH-typetranscriptional regulator YopO [Striga asiatica]